MICTEFVVNNELIQDLYGIPRIAIYLDGYQYHASKEHNRFITDFQKRKSIVNSRNHFSWTLTWADIELFDAELNNNEVIEKGDFLAERLKIDSYTKTKSTILKAVRRESSSINSYTNNFSRLLESIKLLNDINILKKDISLYMSFFQKQLFNPSFAPEKVDEAINNANHDNYCIANKTLNGLIPASIVDENPLFNLNLAVNIDTSKIFGQYKLKHIEDINKDHWNTFWIIYNLLQFFELKEKAELVDEIKELSSNLNLAEIQGQFDSNYHPIIEKLYNCGQLKSEEDEIKLYSLTDNKGDVLAEAEFIIESLKKVVNPFSPEDKSVFTKYGFKEIGIEELKNIEL